MNSKAIKQRNPRSIGVLARNICPVETTEPTSILQANVENTVPLEVLGRKLIKRMILYSLLQREKFLFCSSVLHVTEGIRETGIRCGPRSFPTLHV